MSSRFSRENYNVVTANDYITISLNISNNNKNKLGHCKLYYIEVRPKQDIRSEHFRQTLRPNVLSTIDFHLVMPTVADTMLELCVACTADSNGCICSLDPPHSSMLFAQPMATTENLNMFTVSHTVWK